MRKKLLLSWDGFCIFDIENSRSFESTLPTVISIIEPEIDTLGEEGFRFRILVTEDVPPFVVMVIFTLA